MHNCERCKKPIVGKRPQALYCSDECRIEMQNRRRSAKRREQQRAGATEYRCEFCGRYFATKHTKKRFCGKVCRTWHYNWLRKKKRSRKRYGF